MSENPVSDEQVLARIYSLRRAIAAKRQSRHMENLSKLETYIESLPLQHPYQLSAEAYGEMSKRDIFAKGSQGLQADPSEGEYLYRLCSLAGVKEFTTWKAGAQGNEKISKIFNRLLADYRRTNQWLPLSNYAAGELKDFLGFTWWTSLSLTPDEVVQGALKLGLILRGEYKLLLRCPVSFVKSQQLARVPTVLDAFANDIFHPTTDADSPKHGVTISLERLKDLEEGAHEFVLGPIDVGQIRLCPVYVTDEMKSACPLWLEDEARWQLLEVYYGRLLT